MALTISTGFVVDDAIVMIENIVRYIEEGEKPLEAALKGAEQIGFTIVSLTISLIAVLIPLLFMGDIVGRLFREFAITLSVTILVSAVVSLTLTPMMCARCCSTRRQSQQGRFYRSVRARISSGSSSFTAGLCKWVLKHQTRDAACGRRDAGADRSFSTSSCPRDFSRSGYRHHSGNFRSAADHFLCRDGREAAGTRAGHPERSGRRKSFVLHRRGRHEYHAQQRTHSDQSEAAGRARRSTPPT